MFILSFNPHEGQLSPFTEKESSSSGSLSDLLKVTPLVSDRVKT